MNLKFSFLVGNSDAYMVLLYIFYFLCFQRHFFENNIYILMV